MNTSNKAETKARTQARHCRNDRLFVERVEEIIAKDVDEFSNTKAKLSDIDSQIDKLIESKMKK